MDCHSSLGEPMVSGCLSSTSPRNSVLFSLGVSNSGKTHTLLGGRQESDMGLLPRVLMGLWRGERKIAGVKVRAVEVYNEMIYDLVREDQGAVAGSGEVCGAPDEAKSGTKRKGKATDAASGKVARFTRSSLSRRASTATSDSKPLSIRQENGNFYVADMNCMDITDKETALPRLFKCLESSTKSHTEMNSSSSRGHTVVLLQPYGAGEGEQEEGDKDGDAVSASQEFGQIMVVDMAGLERTKKSQVYGTTMRESNKINQSIMRVLACLKILKWNGEGRKQKKLVPFRESKLTMLLQPVLSGPSDAIPTSVTMLLSVYEGGKDREEKAGLLREIEGLRGIKVPHKKEPIKSRYSVR